MQDVLRRPDESILNTYSQLLVGCIYRTVPAALRSERRCTNGVVLKYGGGLTDINLELRAYIEEEGIHLHFPVNRYACIKVPWLAPEEGPSREQFLAVWTKTDDKFLYRFKLGRHGRDEIDELRYLLVRK